MSITINPPLYHFYGLQTDDRLGYSAVSVLAECYSKAQARALAWLHTGERVICLTRRPDKIIEGDTMRRLHENEVIPEGVMQ